MLSKACTSRDKPPAGFLHAQCARPSLARSGPARSPERLGPGPANRRRKMRNTTVVLERSTKYKPGPMTLMKPDRTYLDQNEKRSVRSVGIW